jgi:hypothetical protein
MANRKFLLGMLTITLVFGLMVTACEGGDSALNGTWKGTIREYDSWDPITQEQIYKVVNVTAKFASGAFELTQGTDKHEGTYMAKGGDIFFTVTKKDGQTLSAPETYPGSYVISGKKLRLTTGWAAFTLDKQ